MEPARVSSRWPSFRPWAGVLADVPQICRVQGGNTKTIWGVGFTPDQTEVWDSQVAVRRGRGLGGMERDA